MTAKDPRRRNWQKQNRPNVSQVVGWAAASSQDARELARRKRMQTMRLTIAERETCADELAEQYALGRLDDPEFGRRLDLLHNAVTHADLTPVFAGLPMPSLYAPRMRPVRWRWIAFAGAVWMALPFVLVSLALVLFGREIGAAIFGIPALLWVALFWRWASKDRR